jgi:dipeptidase E
MKLFLISIDAGIPKEVTEDFLKLLRKNPKDTNVCFIPTAANHPTIDDWFVKRDRDRLEDMGFKVTDVDLKQESENTLSKKLDGFDMVFVTGGNTFYLLEQVRDSEFDKAIKGFLDKGGIYVGASAGSLVAGLNIEPAGWKHNDRNIVNLKDLTAMRLVPFVISVHLDDKNIDLIRSCASKVDYPVIALTDKQALLVDGNEQRIVGVGEKHVFNMPRDLL